MKILICGGGTGGHVYPALAVASELRRRGLAPEQFLWIGTRGQMEEELVPRAGLPITTIAGGPIVGVPARTLMMNAARLTWSVGSAGRIIRRFRPAVLLLTGGYVNVPVALVARQHRLPAVAYLPDVEPGSALRLLERLRLVRQVGATTADSARYLPAARLTATGYPVRPELRAANMLSQAEALSQFDLAPGRRTLFVFGGSRGARSINQALLAALPALLAEFQVIHISGQLDWPEVAARRDALPAAQQTVYRPYAYLHDRMGVAYRAADLVLARAGASMLGECPAFGVPAILVPYPHAWRYQKVNADYLASRGAAVRLNDEHLGERLLTAVRELLQDDARLAAMAAAARAMDVPDAAARLADLVLAVGQE